MFVGYVVIVDVLVVGFEDGVVKVMCDYFSCIIVKIEDLCGIYFDYFV